MLNIPCPYCGNRSETEFSLGGAVKPPRPKDPNAVSDADWAEYLTVHDNAIGVVDEEWWHVHGCGKWFVIRRNTQTHEIEQEQGQ